LAYNSGERGRIAEIEAGDGAWRGGQQLRPGIACQTWAKLGRARTACGMRGQVVCHREAGRPRPGNKCRWWRQAGIRACRLEASASGSHRLPAAAEL